MKCFACGFDSREEKAWVAPAILKELNNGKEVGSADLHKFTLCGRCHRRLIEEQGALKDGFRLFTAYRQVLASHEAAAARTNAKLGVLGAALKKAGLVKEEQPETASPAAPQAQPAGVEIIPAGQAPAEAQASDGGNGIAHS